MTIESDLYNPLCKPIRFEILLLAGCLTGLDDSIKNIFSVMDEDEVKRCEDLCWEVSKICRKELEARVKAKNNEQV